MPSTAKTNADQFTGLGSVRNFMFGISDANSENRPPGSFSSAF